MVNIENLKNELDKYDVFNTKLPTYMTELANTIPNTDLPYKMKLTVAISYLILYMSEFRRNILISNGSLIPINAISFILAVSGAGKDSAINLMKRNFSKGYKEIDKIRNNLAITKAIEIAKANKSNKLSKRESPDTYLKYYEEPMPLFTAPSTNEGYIQYLNTLDNDRLGSGLIYSGEFATELSSPSQNLVLNFQLLSELYDEGKKEVKVIKDKERQSKEIKNLPVSGLFVSSPDNIIFNETNKKKFRIEFTSKLARRSFFNYNKEDDTEKIVYNEVKDMIEDQIAKQNASLNLRNKYNDIFYSVALYQLSKNNVPLKVSEETDYLMTLYRLYNKENSDKVDTRYPISKLVLAHLYWKALKLSGAIAMLKEKDVIDVEDYVEAIRFVELLNLDMTEFEKDLNKQPYELFKNYANKLPLDKDNSCYVSIHELAKNNFLTASGNITTKIKDFVAFVSSCDLENVYTAEEKGITFTKIIKSPTMGISFKECSGDKDTRAKNSSNGFSYSEITFKDLADMLKGDYAYSPFKFINGIRTKTNVEGSIKWIALDVDKSIFTDKQMHEILKEFNHHIVRTSDKSNAYKFRVLLELDSYVKLDDIQYKSFISSISEYLSIDADILPRSQIYFSYKDRDILSVTNQEPLEVRDHLINAYEKNYERVNISAYSTSQKQALLQDLQGTFNYAFEAKDGEGSVSLIRAARHAKDLGMSKDEVLNLMEEINSYWSIPMDRKRFENTILNQIKNWEF